MSGSSWRCRWAPPQAAIRSHPWVYMHIVALQWERCTCLEWLPAHQWFELLLHGQPPASVHVHITPPA